MRKLVTILSGIPGSGKSSWARLALEKTHADPDMGFAAVCSADAYFMSSGVYKFDKTKLGDAHALCLAGYTRRVLDVLPGVFDKHLIVDNTNTTALEIAPYAALALAFGWGLEIVTFKCAPELGAARNVHGVSLKTCKDMSERIARRRLPERWARYERVIEVRE